jgi:predicted sulfurtransferase
VGHHIEGAVQVPRELLEFVADPASPKHKPELDPTRRVIVYCNSGGRGALAAATLESIGFENVGDVKGGFTGEGGRIAHYRAPRRHLGERSSVSEDRRSVDATAFATDWRSGSSGERVASGSVGQWCQLRQFVA